jgi:hypothetical protein
MGIEILNKELELNFFGVISIEAKIRLLFPLKPIDPTKLSKDDGKMKER